MSIVIDATWLLAIAALSDQAITIIDRIKRSPYMSREELAELLKGMGVDTDELIDQVQADLEKLRAQIKEV